MNQLIEEVIELAKEVESEDKIDFAKVLIDKESAYRVVALGLMEQFMSLPEEDRTKMLLATSVHLIVENMILNLIKEHYNEV